MNTDGNVWIQGAGELASGVAVRLARCGYRVLMAELPAPLTVRRLVSYSDVIHVGRTTVAGMPGRLLSPDAAAFPADGVAVIVDPQGAALARVPASAVVDARLTKRPPVPLVGAGSLPVIGLGPGFRCGRDADLIVETHRGAVMGEVLDRGEAAANTGVPGEVGGEAARRIVRAPAGGRLEALVSIGSLVVAGQVLGSIAGRTVAAPLAGLVRGLVHGSAELHAGEKVGDIDPRGAAIDPARVSDKSWAVAGGVLEALLRLGIRPADDPSGRPAAPTPGSTVDTPDP